MIALTMRTRVGMHGTDEGKFVGALGHVGHQLAKVRTRHIGRDRLQLASNLRGRIWLEVIHVNVARTTLQKHENHIDLLVTAAARFACQNLRQGDTQW